jgi:hypothetical protein
MLMGKSKVNCSQKGLSSGKLWSFFQEIPLIALAVHAETANPLSPIQVYSSRGSLTRLSICARKSALNINQGPNLPRESRQAYLTTISPFITNLARPLVTLTLRISRFPSLAICLASR